MASNNDKKLLNLRDKKTVYATASNPHHKTGAPLKVHPDVADSLIDKGYACKTEAEAKKTVDKKAEKDI